MKNPKFTLFIILCVLCSFAKTQTLVACTLVCNSEIEYYYQPGVALNITSDEMLNDFLEVAPDCPVENLSLVLYDNTGTEIIDPVFDASDEGTSLTYVITDSESENSCWGNVVLQLEDTPPVTLCLVGLTTAITASPGEVWIWAMDFDAGSYNPAGGEVTLGIRVLDESNPDAPFEPSLIFNCETGVNEEIGIELQGTNEAGISSSCFTYIYISFDEAFLSESSVDYGACESNVDAAIDISFVAGDFDFSWEGPDGFVSTEEDIEGLVPGLYILTTSNANCSKQDSFLILEEDCVWPGDTNNDGIANNFDILNMGAAFGTTGLARNAASTVWGGQAAADWPEVFVDGLNYKHADADGSGFVDLDDLTVLENNYGFTFDYEEPVAEASVDGAVPFYVEPITLYPNEAFTLPVILGAEDNQAEDITGVAFTITYDPEVIIENSVQIDALDSWLGEDGNTMFKIQQDIYGEGRIEVGLSRIDGGVISGFGQLCRLNIIIEDVIFLNAFSESSDKVITYFNIENVRLLNSSGLGVETAQINDPIIILEPEGTRVDDLEDHVISVYPNPAKAKVFVASDVAIKTLEVLGADGHVYLKVKDNFGNKSLDVSSLLSGIYYLKVETQHGFEMQRLIILE